MQIAGPQRRTRTRSSDELRQRRVRSQPPHPGPRRWALPGAQAATRASGKPAPRGSRADHGARSTRWRAQRGLRGTKRAEPGAPKRSARAALPGGRACEKTRVGRCRPLSFVRQHREARLKTGNGSGVKHAGRNRASSWRQCHASEIADVASAGEAGTQVSSLHAWGRLHSSRGDNREEGRCRSR